MPPRATVAQSFRNVTDLFPMVTDEVITYEDTRIVQMDHALMLRRLQRLTSPLKMYVLWHRLELLRRQRAIISNSSLNAVSCGLLKRGIEIKLPRQGFDINGLRAGIGLDVRRAEQRAERLFCSGSVFVFTAPRTDLPGVRPTPLSARVRPNPARVLAVPPNPRVVVIPREDLHEMAAERNAVGIARTRSKNTLKGGLMDSSSHLRCIHAMPSVLGCLGEICAAWRIFDGEVGYCGLAGKPEIQRTNNDGIRTITREVK